MAAPEKSAGITDETSGWARKDLAWSMHFGTFENAEEREVERKRIHEALEKTMRELGYSPHYVPVL